MLIRQEPLQYYVDRLKNKEYFSLARYGDGEWYCMWGRRGKNSNGCDYYPELRMNLLQTLTPKEGFIHGMQRILPMDLKKALGMTKDIEWLDSEIFGDELVAGGLYPLIEQLRKMKVVIISNKTVRDIKNMIDYDHFIEVPAFNAYDHRQRVYKEIFEYGKPAVYLFSCGMAANVFVYDLHNKIKNSFFIDIGHIWDPFVGILSRFNLHGLTQEQILRNLCPK